MRPGLAGGQGEECYLPPSHWEVINQQESAESLDRLALGLIVQGWGLVHPGLPQENITEAKEERWASERLWPPVFT